MAKLLYFEKKLEIILKFHYSNLNYNKITKMR